MDEQRPQSLTGQHATRCTPDLSITCLRHPRCSEIFQFVQASTAQYHGPALEIQVCHYGTYDEVRVRIAGCAASEVVRRGPQVFPLLFAALSQEFCQCTAPTAADHGVRPAACPRTCALQRAAKDAAHAPGARQQPGSVQRGGSAPAASNVRGVPAASASNTFVEGPTLRLRTRAPSHK